jgi:plastocyanin
MKRGILIVGLVAVLGACSPSSPAALHSSSTDTTVLPSTALAVTASEFTYDITDLAVPVGEEVSVHFTNGGTIPHEWAVLKQGVHIDTKEQFREDMVLFEVEALPEGRSTTQAFTLDVAGDYQFVCALEGHFAAGMHGRLAVVA